MHLFKSIIANYDKKDNLVLIFLTIVVVYFVISTIYFHQALKSKIILTSFAILDVMSVKS